MNLKPWLTLMTVVSLGWAGRANAHMIETHYLLPTPTPSAVTAQDPDSSALEITVTFSSGEPYANAKVEIFAPGNPDTPWAEATTDDQGQYRFTPPADQPGDWTVNIGEDSHWDSLTVPVQGAGDQGIEYGTISDAGARFPAAPIAVGAIAVVGMCGCLAFKAQQARL